MIHLQESHFEIRYRSPDGKTFAMRTQAMTDWNARQTFKRNHPTYKITSIRPIRTKA